MVVGSPAKVKAIHLGEDERMAKKFNPETLAKALSGMHEDGVVVLKNVIPVEEIDKINAWIFQDAERRLKDPSQKYNHGVKCTSSVFERFPASLKVES
jgi:predicted O-methyltransferase YrrM